LGAIRLRLSAAAGYLSLPHLSPLYDRLYSPLTDALRAQHNAAVAGYEEHTSGGGRMYRRATAPSHSSPRRNTPRGSISNAHDIFRHTYCRTLTVYAARKDRGLVCSWRRHKANKLGSAAVWAYGARCYHIRAHVATTGFTHALPVRATYHRARQWPHAAHLLPTPFACTDVCAFAVWTSSPGLWFAPRTFLHVLTLPSFMG